MCPSLTAYALELRYWITEAIAQTSGTEFITHSQEWFLVQTMVGSSYKYSCSSTGFCFQTAGGHWLLSVLSPHVAVKVLNIIPIWCHAVSLHWRHKGALSLLHYSMLSTDPLLGKEQSWAWMIIASFRNLTIGKINCKRRDYSSLKILWWEISPNFKWTDHNDYCLPLDLDVKTIFFKV